MDHDANHDADHDAYHDGDQDGGVNILCKRFEKRRRVDHDSHYLLSYSVLVCTAILQPLKLAETRIGKLVQTF